MVLDGNTRALLGKNRTDLNLKVLQDYDPGYLEILDSNKLKALLLLCLK